MQRAVRAGLRRSRISVHLIGQEYGACPDGDIHSYAYWQHKLAGEHVRDPQFARLIWMPKGNKPEELRQWKFLRELQNSKALERTDLLQTSLEEFKSAIQDKLKGEATPPPAGPAAEARGAPLVYIIFDKLDADAVRPLDDYLLAQGYDTALPGDGDDAQLRQEHEANLLKCDAVLIFWNTAPRHWVLTKMSDLQKIRGRDSTREFASKAIYVTGERSPEKERFGARGALVLKNFGEMTPEGLEAELQHFVQEIEEETEGRIRENF